MMTGPNAAIRCPLPVSEIWPLSGEEGSVSPMANAALWDEAVVPDSSSE